MQGTIDLKTAGPIASVRVVGGPAQKQDPKGAGEQQPDGQVAKEQLASVCKALKAAVEKVEDFCRELFSSHHEQIIKLSVAIAEKILLRQIDMGNYDINKIVQEGIKDVSVHTEISVHINPSDMEKLNVLASGQQSQLPDNITLVADSNIAPAHCFVQTPDGIIDYCLENQLRRIETALKGSE